MNHPLENEMQTSKLDETRARLVTAAKNYKDEEPTNGKLRALCEAACAYADARKAHLIGAAAKKSSQRTPTGTLVPFGKSKGKDVAECTSKDLRWLLEVVEQSIENPEKERFRAKNEELYAAIEQELKDRGES